MNPSKQEKQKEQDITDQGLSYFSTPGSVYMYYWKQGILIVDAVLDTILIAPLRIIQGLWRFDLKCRLDIIHLLLVGFVLYVMSSHYYFEIGFWYHIIRGQSQIKLYGIIQILDLLDRLACTQGDYIMRQLYWSKLTKQDSVMNRYLAYSGIYLICHSCLLGLQMIVYNVIFSSNINLLYLALFVLSLIKLKGSVFKKQDQKLIVQMLINDGRELFQKILYILLITMSVKFIPNDYLYKICFYFLVDIVVDSFKYISIMHLNTMPLDIISQYSSELSSYSYALTLDEPLILDNMSVIDQKDLPSVMQSVPQQSLRTLGRLQFLIFPHLVIILKVVIYKVSRSELNRYDMVFSGILIICVFVIVRLHVYLWQQLSPLSRAVQDLNKRKKSQ